MKNFNLIVLNPTWAHTAEAELGAWIVPALTGAIILIAFVVFVVWLWRTPNPPPFTEDQEKRIREIIKDETKGGDSG